MLNVLLALVVAAWSDTPDVSEDILEDEASRGNGTGELAFAATLTTGALALTLARIGVLGRDCPRHGSGAADRCDYESSTDIGLMVPRLVLNIAAVAAAPGTGAMMGRHAARQAALGLGPRREPSRIANIGGGLLAVGILGVATSAGIALPLSHRCIRIQAESRDDLAGERCIMRALPAWTLLSWSSFALSGAGLGLLGFAHGYRRTRANLEHVFALVGPDRVGLGVSGTF